jgi:bacteriorhodopsin
MFVSTLAFAGLSFTVPRSNRVFHYITASITMVAAIAYFTMGADLGETGIAPEFVRTNPKVAGNLREIFYVRYIDW